MVILRNRVSRTKLEAIRFHLGGILPGSTSVHHTDITGVRTNGSRREEFLTH